MAVGAHDLAQHLEHAVPQRLVALVAHSWQRQEVVAHVADEAGDGKEASPSPHGQQSNTAVVYGIPQEAESRKIKKSSWGLVIQRRRLVIKD